MERLEEVVDLQRSIALDRNLDLVGSVQRVLVDRRLGESEPDPEFFAVGRTEGQAFDVDGVTHLVDTGRRADARAVPGSFVDVEIVDVAEDDLIGEVVA
jgi:tRNA A37 methylthiotransferase MiaB